MCGIFGIINTNKRPVDQTELKAGIKKVLHRGPDGEGYFHKDNVGIAACRLAIMDTSDKSHQPFIKDNCVLVFNGAIYNYEEIRKELTKQGVQFQTDGDTEVVLESYKLWGPECLKRFNGMWALAIYNINTSHLFLARDRYGIKPLYIATLKDKWCFASEIKAFTAIDTWQAHANIERLTQYLGLGLQDHTQESMFRHVSQVEAGSWIEYDIHKERIQSAKYYQIDDRQVKQKDPAMVIEEFKSIFNDALKLRIQGKRTFGASLSGGLDSSSIVSHLAHSNSYLKSYSIIFPGEEMDESRYINSVVRHINGKNIMIKPNMEDLWDSLDALVYQQDEPFSSASAFAQYQLFKTVRDHDCQILLDGQGADEILGGYEAFLGSTLKNIKSPIKKILFLKSLFAQPGLSVADALRKFQNSPRIKKQNPPSWLIPDLQQVNSRIDQHTSATSKRLLTNMGLQVLLHYADRNSMAFGIENRLPYLDHRLVDFCLALPDHYKINKGQRKWLLRQAGKDVLPLVVYKRMDKIGFETPQDKWLDLHSDMITNYLVSRLDHIDGLIDKAKFPKTISKRYAWRLLLVAKWQEIFDVSF